MISEAEIKHLSTELGVPLHYVEKDYVMGWLLWGVFSDPFLQQTLILKGGNCLRKVYFPDTRFSDDLDFTSLQLEDGSSFKSRLNAICDLVSAKTGIVFETDDTAVKEKTTPHSDSDAMDARVYFRGIAGDSSVTLRVKFDLSEYEKIVLPVQKHPMIHPFSDAIDCSTEVHTYSIEEVLAEKLRSWIQRTRSRDLFDVVKILESRSIPISKRSILRVFMEKTIFKNVPIAGQQEMLFEDKFVFVERDWLKTIICPSNAVMAAQGAISTFKDFVTALFAEENVAALGLDSGHLSNYSYAIRSGIRESIIQAGRERKLLRLHYQQNGSRDIEPYSFRYRNGREYFFGFDRTRGQQIKQFNLDRIIGVSIMPQVYEPRWVVEF
jgi:predicted nucleotidyltransferase component of viral defense system